MPPETDTTERIRRRAYEIWEREGRPDGREREHWAMAAEEIEREDRAGAESLRMTGQAVPAARVRGTSVDPVELANERSKSDAEARRDRMVAGTERDPLGEVQGTAAGRDEDSDPDIGADSEGDPVRRADAGRASTQSPQAGAGTGAEPERTVGGVAAPKRRPRGAGTTTATGAAKPRGPRTKKT